MDDIERETRLALWAGHGHDCLYGDDGEMQCGKCGSVLNPMGLWDYLRSPLPALAKQVASMAASERARADALEDSVRKGDAQIEGLQADLLTMRSRADTEYTLRTTILDKAEVRRIELEILARDLATCVRDSYGMLAVHHIDMTEIDALLARCREARLDDDTPDTPLA